MRRNENGAHHRLKPWDTHSRDWCRSSIGVWDGHLGWEVDDFVRACHEGTQPPNHVWNAAAYTVPGIVAHESGLRGGELLDNPDLGTPPG